MPAIARVLEMRVRESDIAGWFGESVIGIILPETAAAGAWKLAEDLQSAFDLQRISAEFQVYAYPLADTDDGNPPVDAACPDDQTSVAEKPVQPLGMLFVQKLPVWKRTIDVIGATIGLALASLVMILAAAAIKQRRPDRSSMLSGVMAWGADDSGFTSSAPWSSMPTRSKRRSSIKASRTARPSN